MRQIEYPSVFEFRRIAIAVGLVMLLWVALWADLRFDLNLRSLGVYPRTAEGLKEAIEEIALLRDEFYKDVRVPGEANDKNSELEKAGRVADFLELGELFAKDALMREESCGGHFREEFAEESGPQKGEAKRDDENFAFVAAWEYKGEPGDAQMHKEDLEFIDVELKQRSYK